MTTPVRRILVPVDFSESSRDALRYARGLAQALGASMDVLHVIESPKGMLAGGPPEVADEDEARTRLREFLASAGGAGSVPTTDRVERGNPHERIVALAGQSGIDLVVMGTRGLTGRAHVLVGSVADTVVRTCPRPVLTVREGATARL
jgi:universal stress protein A